MIAYCVTSVLLVHVLEYDAARSEDQSLKERWCGVWIDSQFPSTRVIEYSYSATNLDETADHEISATADALLEELEKPEDSQGFQGNHHVSWTLQSSLPNRYPRRRIGRSGRPSTDRDLIFVGQGRGGLTVQRVSEKC